MELESNVSICKWNEEKSHKNVGNESDDFNSTLQLSHKHITDYINASGKLKLYVILFCFCVVAS